MYLNFILSNKTSETIFKISENLPNFERLDKKLPLTCTRN